MHRDLLGLEINVGDIVVTNYGYGRSGVSLQVVTKLTPKMIKTSTPLYYLIDGGRGATAKDPSYYIKLEGDCANDTVLRWFDKEIKQHKNGANSRHHYVQDKLSQLVSSKKEWMLRRRRADSNPLEQDN